MSSSNDSLPKPIKETLKILSKKGFPVFFSSILGAAISAMFLLDHIILAASTPSYLGILYHYCFTFVWTIIGYLFSITGIVLLIAQIEGRSLSFKETVSNVSLLRKSHKEIGKKIDQIISYKSVLWIPFIFLALVFFLNDPFFVLDEHFRWFIKILNSVSLLILFCFFCFIFLEMWACFIFMKDLTINSSATKLLFADLKKNKKICRLKELAVLFGVIIAGNFPLSSGIALIYFFKVLMYLTFIAPVMIAPFIRAYQLEIRRIDIKA